MSRVYGGVVSTVRTLDAQTANVTGNINFPQGGDILGAGFIECNTLSATNISGDLNPVNETLTNTTLSGFTNIIGGDLTFLSNNDILGVNDITATGDISANGFLRVGGNIVGDASGSVAGNFYAENIFADTFIGCNTLTAGGDITCNQLNYTTLNPPVSLGLGLGQVLANSTNASGQDISNVGDIIAHTNADFHIRNDSTDGDMLLQTTRNLVVNSGLGTQLNSVAGTTINSQQLAVNSDSVVMTLQSCDIDTTLATTIDSTYGAGYGVVIKAQPILPAYGSINIQALNTGGTVDIDAQFVNFRTTNCVVKATATGGIFEAYQFNGTYVDNTADAQSSAQHMNKYAFSGGFRDSLNWVYMLALNNVGQTIAYSRIKIGKAYFATEQHPIWMSNDAQTDISFNHYGLIVSSDVNARGFIKPPVINDAHVCGKICDKAKDKNIYGVLSYYDFAIQPHSYSLERPDKDPDGEVRYVNSGGEGMVYVCDICGSLEAGDYITSSNIPGLGMKQDDDVHHSYTMAKSVGDVDFGEPRFPGDPSFSGAVGGRTPSHYYSWWAYDDKYNADRNPEDIHKEVEAKYKVLYGQIYADKYVVYNDIAKTDDAVHFKVDYDFAGKKPDLVGLDFKCALVSCVYQN